MNDSPSLIQRLPRVLGPITATAIVVGTVIGSGVFKKAHVIATDVPHSGLVAVVWILGGVLVLLGALAYAEVAVLFPRAGGNYVFLREGFGRLAGFLWGWVEFWIIRSASLAALATVFTEAFNDVLGVLPVALGYEQGLALGFWPQRLLTVAILVGLAGVNMRGAKWGGGLQVFITVLKIASLLGIAVLPAIVLWRGSSTGTLPSLDHARPFWPTTWTEVSLSGLGSAMLGVLWAYHGWMNIAPIAEEVRRPQRNLPLALLVGVSIVVALYLGANFAYYLTMSGREMAGIKDRPIATEYAFRLLGSAGTAAASLTILCSVFGALNGNLLVGPRLLYAMGEDGLAPSWLRAIHSRYQTPVAAIAVLTAWAVLLVLSVAVFTKVGLLDPAKSHFDRLTDFAMFGAVIFETMAVLSIFVFRWKLPEAERPYRCPGYPVVPALYFVLPAFVLVNMFVAQPVEAMAGLGFIALGAVLYFGLGLQRGTTGGTSILDREPPKKDGASPSTDVMKRDQIV